MLVSAKLYIYVRKVYGLAPKSIWFLGGKCHTFRDYSWRWASELFALDNPYIGIVANY